MSVRAKSAARKGPRRVAKKPVAARQPTHKPPKRAQAERNPQPAPIPLSPELVASVVANEEAARELPLGMRVMEAAAQVADN